MHVAHPRVARRRHADSPSSSLATLRKSRSDGAPSNRPATQGRERCLAGGFPRAKPKLPCREESFQAERHLSISRHIDTTHIENGSVITHPPSRTLYVLVFFTLRDWHWRNISGHILVSFTLCKQELSATAAPRTSLLENRLLLTFFEPQRSNKSTTKVEASPGGKRCSRHKCIFAKAVGIGVRSPPCKEPNLLGNPTEKCLGNRPITCSPKKRNRRNMSTAKSTELFAVLLGTPLERTTNQKRVSHSRRFLKNTWRSQVTPRYLFKEDSLLWCMCFDSNGISQSNTCCVPCSSRFL